MQASWPVGAEQQRLLDIGRSRRSSNEIERARRAALAVSRAHLGEHALVIGFDRLSRQNDNVVVGKKVKGGRIVRPGDEGQRAGLGDACEGRGDSVDVAS